MRYLPDRPSLDYLRKEAKDVLVTLRESDSAATLSDAQQALALQYGMRHWNALRAEVRRGADCMPVAPDGLAVALAAAFDLGTVNAEPVPVAFSPMGRSWCVSTDRGRWLAGPVYPFITDARAEIGGRLRNAAVAAGIAAPDPVRSAHGRLVETVHSEKWRIDRWVESGPTPVTPVSAAVAGRMGAIYGTLHSLAIPWDEPIGWYGTRSRPPSDWEKLLDRARAAGKPWAQPLGDVVPELQELSTIRVDVSTDDFILCNRNAIPEHVRISRGGELVVTEWAFAGSSTAELELASALLAWMVQPFVNLPAIAAFRDGYVGAGGRWPRFRLESFATAALGWLNWTYNAICESIGSDGDLGRSSELATMSLLRNPLTRSSLQDLIDELNDKVTH